MANVRTAYGKTATPGVRGIEVLLGQRADLFPYLMVVMVLLTPPSDHQAPQTAEQIRQRAQELAFTSPLMRELQWLADWRDPGALPWPAGYSVIREKKAGQVSYALATCTPEKPGGPDA